MVSILNDDFSALNDFVNKGGYSKIFFLLDENTHQYCLPIVLGNLETDIPFEIIEIEQGEELKNIDTAIQIWEILAEFQADRKSLLINLGGGVITDMGGFVASTYKRGMDFINIPTTLLAMCDASIGGKTGIDHLYLKNIIGTFAFPKEIFVYPEFLKTLPFVELRSGFAEMLKHGLIADIKHWEALSQIQELLPENIAPHIPVSMEIKQNIVKQDFTEKNIRKTLNFGHSVGHAIESLFLKEKQPIPHGEGVALGMIIETYLSYLEKLIPLPDAENIIGTIRQFYPYINIQLFENEAIKAVMMNDKKNNNGKLMLSLIDRKGHAIYDYQAQTSHIDDALRFYKNLNH
ncbi:3-dehydroquinate synthase [Riemerella columbipharyngis]|uniref:3-dehydroquinate synthase n=1 Tax=Riemerella columbipharyngis TaxID=1071918 RepID=A0A1G7BJA7_9FLAO|nr:3-dehydroquinate synthase [Riemerella columbipharyngis]SDE27007.1 3-dehydroquinate synthase [Riemerella columbipharyngis]